jgi:hypothetical protein
LVPVVASHLDVYFELDVGETMHTRLSQLEFPDSNTSPATD